ncbi:hypothetical protein B0H14DRAFT_3507453 [Mycena olivaceomarginata]|nr:hypothetical protein B0H14DRAFT_3507453 [Mycena olivaceomarginata]
MDLSPSRSDPLESRSRPIPQRTVCVAGAPGRQNPEFGSAPPCNNALAVAKRDSSYLEAHFKLALKTLCKDAFGGILTFHVEGGFKHVKKVINSLKLASHLANLGAFRSFGLKPLGKT